MQSTNPKNSRDSRGIKTYGGGGAIRCRRYLCGAAIPPSRCRSPYATLVTSPSAARLLAWVAFTPMPALSAVPTAGRLAVAALAADEERREAALLDIGEGID